MIAFIASLYDPTTGISGVTMDSGCTTFTIIDYSNYTTNTTPGHAITDFSQFRTIVITHQSGATYILSSVSPADQTILPGNSGINTFTCPVFAGDGVYTFQLFTVPTYNSVAAYVGNTADVYYNGNFYQAIANTTGNLPTNTTYWSAPLASQVDLLSAYQDDAPGAVSCALSVCMNNAVAAAVCAMNTCNNYEWCNNPKSILANKLTLLYYNIQAAMNAGNIQSAEDSFDLAATLCVKCPSC